MAYDDFTVPDIPNKDTKPKKPTTAKELCVFYTKELNVFLSRMLKDNNTISIQEIKNDGSMRLFLELFLEIAIFLVNNRKNLMSIIEFLDLKNLIFKAKTVVGIFNVNISLYFKNNHILFEKELKLLAEIEKRMQIVDDIIE